MWKCKRFQERLCDYPSLMMMRNWWWWATVEVLPEAAQDERTLRGGHTVHWLYICTHCPLVYTHYNNWSSTCSSQYASKVRSKNISQFFWWQFSTHLSNNILPKWTTLWFTRDICIKDFLISKNKNYWFLLTSYLSYSQLLHIFFYLSSHVMRQCLTRDS